MPHQVTITAPTGPARQVTAGVLPAVVRVDFDLADKTIQIYQDSTQGTLVKEFDINASTVVTCTITSGNFAFVVS